jgi:hypothetical protein
MRTILFALTILAFFSGCNIREREQQLDERAALLDQKEQELLLKEKSLVLREQVLISKENKKDSTILSDTAAVFEPALQGSWSVNMLCTEATCPGSAVGDTKNEVWQFSFQDKTILVRAMSGEQLVRVYSGIYNGNVIDLAENTAKPNQQLLSKISVRLRITDSISLEGHREILREGNCRIVYHVNMTKQ